jgi:hypothetical protein
MGTQRTLKNSYIQQTLTKNKPTHLRKNSPLLENLPQDTNFIQTILSIKQTNKQQPATRLQVKQPKRD